jgi:phage terminase small subunit
MARLTAKQEAFCQYIVDGHTQKDSYILAYDARGADGTTSTNAHQLINQPHVAKRIEELRAIVAERVLFPRIERLQVLKDIAVSGEKDSDKISAIKVFSDMLGDNAPQKIEIEDKSHVVVITEDESKI